MDLLFANVPENILIFDGEGRLLQCSTHFLRQVDIDRFEHIAGWHFTRLYRLFGDDDFVEGAVKRFEYVKQGRKTAISNVRLDFPSQHEKRLFNLHAAPMLDESGLLDGVIVIFHDSTEHVLTEADERTRAMLNASPFALSLWNEDHQALDCNEAALEMFGASSVEEFKQRTASLLPPAQPNGENSAAVFHDMIRKTFESGQEERELLAQTLSGDPLPTELTFVRVKWGSKYGVVCHAHDLRAQQASQASQAEIREADARRHIMLDAVPLACTFWDENQNIIDCNYGCLVLFGLSSKEEYRRRFHELSPEFQPDGSNSRETIFRHNRWVYETGQQQRYEWIHWNPDTKRRFLTEVSQVRVPWKNGYQVVSYVRDMSEIEASEARRREAEAHSRELEVQTRAAKVASAAKSQFLATMSHEIRTPMNAIIGMSELLRTDNLDDTQKDFINDIRKMSDSLLHIINGILDFSKIEAGKLELTPVHFDLLELHDNICSINRFAAESKNLRFTASMAPDVPRVLYGDDVRIRQVITNILGNAIKYTHQGGVDFKVGRVDKEGESWLSFAVADTGIGIRQEDFPHLFDAFAQIDRKTNRGQTSTGLGLPITQSLVSLMKGRIDIQSEYGVGSLFTILLPLVPGDPAQIEKANESTQGFRAPDAKVLVVDDNKINLKVALAYLAGYGIQADTALDGIEAIAKIMSNDYDMVFMDQMMPEMDGLEATRKIRALGTEKYRKLAIVALTANAVRGAEQIFLDAGMNGFIAKPIDVDELSRILMTWLPPERIVALPESVARADAPTPSTASSSSVIDRELGLKNATNDPLLYRQLLADFAANHARDADRMRERLADKDFTSARRLAHTLKSTAAIIGATALSRASAALERALKEQREDAALLGAVVRELAIAISTLPLLPPSPAAEASAATDDFSPAAALALADELETLLASGNTAALGRIPGIQRLFSPFNEYCGLIVKQIEDFDFNCARQTLLSIRAQIETRIEHGN
jgi:signal transduction histidine kinase/CheY-like chemotaxis protein